MQHLDQKGLADRWLISPRTLEQWRWQGRGPQYLKICGHVVYRLSDIEAFEAAALHNNTVGPIDIGNDKKASDGIRGTIAKPRDIPKFADRTLMTAESIERPATEVSKVRPQG